MLRRNRVLLLVIVVLTLDSFVTLGSALNIKRNKRNVDENGDDETFTETNADLPETTPIVFTDRLESSPSTESEAIFYNFISFPDNITNDCKSIPGALYIDGKCQCPDKQYMEDNRCHLYAEHPEDAAYSAKGCNPVSDAEYVDGKCKCRHGYYSSTYTCFGYATKPYDFAISERGCVLLANVRYLNNRCHCIYGYYSDGEKCSLYATKPGDSVALPLGCESVPGTVYKEGKCDCMDGYYAEDNRCYLYATKPYELVHSENGCANVNNTIFVYKKCQCKEGYYLEDDQCHIFNNDTQKNDVEFVNVKNYNNTYKSLFIEHPKFILVGPH